MEIKEVTVYLDDTQAKQFVLFQQHWSNINTMIESKVFEQKGAAITLHFDKFGVLRNITRSDVLYDYRSEFKNSN